MKRRLMLFVTIIMMFVFAGCGGTKQDLPTVPEFSDDTYECTYTKVSSVKFGPGDDITVRGKMDQTMQDYVNELCADLCLYLNTEFKISWSSSPVEVYLANVTEYVTTAKACYAGNGKIYIGEQISINEIDDELHRIIVHELLHHLHNINIGKFFALYKNDVECCGVYLEEAFIDALAVRYMKNRVPQFEVSGGYIERAYIELLELEIPDIYSYFFNSDISGLQEVFDKHASKFVTTVGSPFEKWCCMMDEAAKTQNMEYRDYRFSIIMSFMSLTTSRDSSDEFIKIFSSLGLDGSIFVPYMY